MATISKRATGYQAQIRRKGFPTISKMFETRREAVAWSRSHEAEMDKGAYLDRTEAERTTLGDFLSDTRRRLPHTRSQPLAKRSGLTGWFVTRQTPAYFEFKLTRSTVSDVLNQLFNSATEIAAQSVKDVWARIVTTMVR